ncbi:MAG: Rib/alpha-like domain-containing protein, partial [[Ruminococcus] torques]
TGYYRIQDIDGDGKLDEEEANNEQSPYIGVPKITAPYEGDNKVKAVVHLNENAGKGNKAQLINKNGVVVATINNVDAEENGIPKTIDRELEFTVTDSSVLGKAGDKLTVKIIPSDERYEKAEEAETKVKEAPKAVKDPLRVVKGKDLTEDTVLAKKGVENSNKMPGGTTYRWKTAPNTSQAGNTTGIVSVTVPDREEAFEVTVPIEVFLADADKYTPQTTSIIKEYGTSTTEEEIIGAVTVPGYPEDTVDELEIALDNATQIPDGNTAGDYPVDVTVTYPDGSEDKVQVTVTVKEQKDNEKYIPEFDQINKNYGEATTEEEIKGALKEESVPENMEVTVKNPENLPDGMTEGTFEIEVTVEYPDGTSEDTTVQVVVTDNRTDAEKYTPEFDQIEKNYGEATTEEEIKGALKEESVPENTEVTVKNPENLPDGMTEGTFEIEVTVEYPDGTSEDTTVQVVVTDNRTDAEKYTPEFDQIEKNYGEATTEEEIKGALKEESVPENTEVTVKNPESLPDGMTEGTFEIEVTVEYPDGTSEDTTVQVVVTDNRTDAEKYTPEFDQIEKNYGEATTEEEIKGALKEESVPENTEVTVKNPESLPDGMTEGTFEIEVTVEYPDGTSEDTTVQVVVTDNFLVVTKNPPKQIDGQRVAENTNVITANLTFTVEGVHDEGLNSGLSIDENGNLTGTPKLNWGDKNSDTYEEQTVVLHAIATAESGSKKPVTISVVVQRDTDGDGEPDITDTDDDGDGFTDIEEEEKGTDPKDPNSVPQVDPIVAPTIGEIEDQTVVEGNAITPVTPEVTEGSNVTVEGLPEGVMFENGTIQGTPKVTWNGSEESRAITVTVKAEKDGATGRETFVITVQRDTDGDGEPDITDTDDDGDGFTDIEEEEKGTDPKDPNSVPQVDPIVAPTIGEIEDQTVVEGNAITPVTPEVTEGSNVTVEGLPEGVMFENGTIQGTPKVTWNGSEESRAITVTVKAEKDGATGRETFVITVQRDTDGDGEPDITDTDDDGDGFTDIEEEEKGTDPKDPNSVPQVDPIVAPTIGEIEDQTVVEGNAITPVTPEVTEGSNVTVEGLPEGVMFENGTIQGTPKVTWNGSEESRAITVTVKAEKDGATGRETFVITVQRDTDGDGEPDITDTDDDGDGFTDIEEEEKGTDPKDPNSVPQVDPIVAPTIGEIEDQTVVEGNAITPVTPEVTEGSNVTVEGLPEGVMFENGTIQGTPKVTWNGSEESRAITVTVKAEKDGATGRETFVITVQRDTDGDGEPDITDTDDDGDGFTDIEEEEKGTDPKDPNSVPQVDPIVAPTIGEIEDQTVVEGNAITPVTPEVTEGSNVTVEGLPEGVMFENGTIQGTPKVTWNGSEESRAITVTVKAEKDGATGRETFVITVQRDTDGDGEPDITDTDDDGDGFTDIEEEEKGTDPKDPNSVPQVDPKPVKPDQKQDPEISQNKVVNNVVNNSYKKPISNAPKTGDFGNGTGYTGLAALAAGLMLLLGIKKKRKEEDGEE